MTDEFTTSVLIDLRCGDIASNTQRRMIEKSVKSACDEMGIKEPNSYTIVSIEPISSKSFVSSVNCVVRYKKQEEGKRNMPTDRSVLKMHEGLSEHECNAPELVKKLRSAKDGDAIKIDEKKVREFGSGATRDSEYGKLDYEGFISPIALERYAEYLNMHRVQSNGQLRSSDNWQKGMPLTVYMKSMWRHFMDVWKLHRGYGPIYDRKTGSIITRDEALCAVIFNAFGQLHEILKHEFDEHKAKEPCVTVGCKNDEAFGDFQ